MTNKENKENFPATPDELAQACAQAMWDADKASAKLGMRIESVTAGRAVLTMTVEPWMTNGMDICHGGLMFTLADSAFAFACNGYNQLAVAQHCSISFLQPVAANTKLTATAIERHREGRSGIYDIRISDDNDQIVAEFRGHSRIVKGTHIDQEGRSQLKHQ